jgi:O-antigen/teichoic acid export membrane protein
MSLPVEGLAANQVAMLGLRGFTHGGAHPRAGSKPQPGMQARRSLWITFGYSNASTIALFVVSLVLARMLSPHDIGVFSLCVVVINIAAVLRDLGGTPYLISKQDVSEADVGAVLGMTITTASLLALGLWFGRHRIAAFFGEPSMAQVLPILLLSFLIVPVAGMLTTLFIRNLSAERNAWVSLSGTVSYALVVLVLAWQGFGAQAQAWANAANIAAGLVCSLWVMPKGLRLRPRWTGWGPVLRYSGGVVLSNLSSVAYNSVPDAAIGRGLGAQSVGVFSRAAGTVGLFMQAIGPTLAYNALPIMAKAHQAGVQQEQALLLRSLQLMTGVAWPLYIWLGFFALPVIQILYGQTWAAAAELVPLLCVAMAARIPFTLCMPALQAIGKPQVAAAASIVGLLLRLVLALLLPWHDLSGFVSVVTLADILAQFAWLYAGHRYLGVRVAQVKASLWISLLVAGPCLLAAWLMRWGLDKAQLTPAAVLLATGLAYSGFWLWLVARLEHPLWNETALLRAKFSAEN